MTHVETPCATEQDVTVVEPMHHKLAEQALLPTIHVGDGAYGASEGRVDRHQDYQGTLTGPMRQAPRWQAHAPQACEASPCLIDWDQAGGTCPQGNQSRAWQPTPAARGQPLMQVMFPKQDGAGCAVRPQCTRSPTGPRELTLHAQAQQRALQAARERQQPESCKEVYTPRAGIEGPLSQAAYALGLRRTRSRGIKKTHRPHIAIATAINLQRCMDWLWEVPRSKTSISHFAR